MPTFPQQKPKNFKQRTSALSRVRIAVLDASERARVLRRSVFRKAEQCVACGVMPFGEHVIGARKLSPLPFVCAPLGPK
jgi:hypothetical protein